MDLNELKNKIINYRQLLDRPTDDQFIPVSLIAIEEVLKKKHLELSEKIKEFESYVSILLNRQCKVQISDEHDTEIKIFYSNFLSSKAIKCYYKRNKDETWLGKDGPWEFFYLGKTDNTLHSDIVCNILENNEVVNEFLKYLKEWKDKYKLPGIPNGIKRGMPTNLGLYVDFKNNLSDFCIVLSPAENHNSKNLDNIFNISTVVLGGFYTGPDVERYKRDLKEAWRKHMWFYYFKNVLTGQRNLKIEDDKIKEVLNEDIIADIYSRIKVYSGGHIGAFSKELQEEFRTFESYYSLKLHESAESEKTSMKIMQTKRITEAYQKFKEAAELLNGLKTEDSFIDKIHVDDLETMFFKNDGKPNEYGFIEINEMFKNNNLLRMLDLSKLDFTNVDIRYMDFSGTNVHINPQTIYNKDMTGVNATGVHFSPFTDSFDNVILDGAIINDYEAMVDLDKLKSYSDTTVIKHEVVSKFSGK